MEIKLKKKYTTLVEPVKWRGKAGPKFRNCGQFGTGGSHSGKKKIKGPKPLGFSGRTIGGLIRRAEVRGLTSQKKKK